MQTQDEGASPTASGEVVGLRGRVFDALWEAFEAEGGRFAPGTAERLTNAVMTALTPVLESVPAPVPVAIAAPLGRGAVVRTLDEVGRIHVPGSIGLVTNQAKNGPDRYRVMFPGDPFEYSLPAKRLEIVWEIDPQSWWKKPKPSGVGLPEVEAAALQGVPGFRATTSATGANALLPTSAPPAAASADTTPRVWGQGDRAALNGHPGRIAHVGSTTVPWVFQYDDGVIEGFYNLAALSEVLPNTEQEASQ